MNEYNNFPHILSLIITTNIWWNIISREQCTSRAILGWTLHLVSHTHKKESRKKKLIFK